MWRRIFLFSIALDLLQQFLPTLPSFVAGFLVGFAGVGGFAGAHEAMARAFIGYRLISLFRFFHELARFRDGRVDAGVVAAVEAVHRASDAGDVFLLVVAVPIENKCGLDGGI